jgi:hypothetical protein
MNQYFTTNTLRGFVDDIRRSMSLAHKVVEFADHLVNEKSEQAETQRPPIAAVSKTSPVV